MKAFKGIVFTLFFIVSNVNAMISIEEKIAKTYFASFIQNILQPEGFNDAILTDLRTTLHNITDPGIDKNNVIAKFAELTGSLLTLFDEQTPCNSMQYIGTEIKNFEDFYYRVNFICNYEKAEFIKKLDRLAISADLKPIIENICKIDMRLRVRLGEKYLNFITRIRLLSIVKYGLLNDSALSGMYKKFFTEGWTMIQRLNSCNNTFASDLVFQEINTEIMGINFSA